MSSIITDLHVSIFPTCSPVSLGTRAVVPNGVCVCPSLLHCKGPTRTEVVTVTRNP